MQEFCSGYKYHSFVDLGLLDENDVLYLFFCVKFHEELNPKHGLNTLELKREKKNHNKQNRPCCYYKALLVSFFYVCLFFLIFLFFSYIVSNDGGNQSHYHHCQELKLLVAKSHGEIRAFTALGHHVNLPTFSCSHDVFTSFVETVVRGNNEKEKRRKSCSV